MDEFKTEIFSCWARLTNLYLISSIRSLDSHSCSQGLTCLEVTSSGDFHHFSNFILCSLTHVYSRSNCQWIAIIATVDSSSYLSLTGLTGALIFLLKIANKAYFRSRQSCCVINKRLEDRAVDSSGGFCAKGSTNRFNCLSLLMYVGKNIALCGEDTLP